MSQRKISKRACIPAIIICLLASTYLTAVYSNNPFIAKWRTIYIETAMSTMTHQWLATAFIPSSVIDKVVADTEKDIADNMVSASGIYAYAREKDTTEELPAREAFAAMFPEIDMETMPEYASYADLQIKDIESMGIKTVAGDAVWAIDYPNNLLIITVKGDNFAGKLAVVHDSSRVVLGKTGSSSSGQTVTDICQNYNAVLGINASGFVDYGGHGDGKTPVGLEISQGTVYYGAARGRNQICGFDNDNNLRLGCDLDINSLRDAIEFYPVIVLNGEMNVNGSFGLGLQPRAVIGQSKDGSTLLLIIDGRQVGYSLGATVSDCADVLLKYDVYNAINLDGGSSASMTYMGEMITKTSSPAKQGRKVPNAWIVLPQIEASS